MRNLLRGTLIIFLAGLALAFVPTPATAHFSLDSQNRIIILDRGDTGADLYLRIPAPLIYASHLSRRTSPGERVAAPFLLPKKIGDGWVHRLNREAIAAAPGAFGELVAGGYRITVNGRVVPARVDGVTVHTKRNAPPFAMPSDARKALDGATTAGNDPFVGDAVVDIALHLADIDGHGSVGIVSTQPRLDLPPNIFIDNHILDYDGTKGRTINLAGQLQDGVILDRSFFRSVSTFVWQGILHILEGLDHVLFVLCLTLAAASFSRLIWSITGFTLGHSVTLIAGFLGFTPGGAWFVPAVEAAIAVSIVYAGAMALFGKSSNRTLWITAAIGLLHGFGFSFVLSDILGRQAPNLIVSLLSFNIGVEIGQILIVSVAWLLPLAARKAHRTAAFGLRAIVAAGSIGIACIWAVERVDILAGVI